MLKQLTFKNKDLEEDFTSSSQKFHLMSFKTLIISVLIQTTALYFANPLNIKIFELSKILTFVTTETLSILIYFLTTKKLERFCYLILPMCVFLIILGACEYLILLRNEIQLDAWAHFLLGINIEAGCLFLLVSRIKWTHSLLVMTFVHIYSWIRITDVFKHPEAKTTAIISLCIHIFLLFSINYCCEKGDRETFQKLKLQNLQQRAYEELIKKVIPNLVIILKEEKVEFLNDVAKNYFGIKEDGEIIQILQKLKISNKDQNKNFTYQSKTRSRDGSGNFSKSIFELAKITEISIFNGKSNFSRGFSGDEVEFENDDSEQHQSFSCHIGPFIWDNNPTVLIILSDISNITHHYKSLDKYKDNLLATVSHDFRTPLNGMLGMMELLLEETKLASQKENLHVTMSFARLLLSMTNDILDFSLISKGKLRLKYESTNVTALIEETAKILQFQANIKGVGLVVQNDIIDKDENHIVDGNRLRQVLLNLIGNALKFTKLGKVTVRIKEEAVDDFDFISNEDIIMNQKQSFDNDEIKEFDSNISCVINRKRLVFEVEDTGIGIKANDLNKLFKLFSKLGDDEGLNKSGIGLGLAISQSLVSLMNANRKGAEIKVESEYRKGSKFTFPIYLEKEPSVFFKEIIGFEKKAPLTIDVKTFNVFQSYDLSSPMSPTLNMVSEADSLIINSKKRYSVLIVDDDSINIIVAKNYMKSINDQYLISTASNGREAIDAVVNYASNHKHYDIILMDCNMPVMDGFEASQKLKLMMSSKVIPYIPIVATTGNVDLGDQERCFSSGMDYFLAKPYSKKQLINTIKEALKIN